MHLSEAQPSLVHVNRHSSVFAHNIKPFREQFQSICRSDHGQEMDLAGLLNIGKEASVALQMIRVSSLFDLKI